MSLPLPLTLALEQTIEAILKLDPETRQRLSALEGKVIRINVYSPSISLFFSVTNARVNVVGGVNEAVDSVDTTISGSLHALRSLSRGNEAVYRGEVSVEGDVGVGQALKGILAGLEVDWEEWVSPLLGDSVSHRLGVASKQLGGWAARTRTAFEQNTRDYLQEEIEVLAPNSLVREFCSEVDVVRANADRLDARLRRLERHHPSTLSGQGLKGGGEDERGDVEESSGGAS